MEFENVWDALILVVTLLGIAGVAILVLSRVVLDEPPEGLAKVRVPILALAGLALLMNLTEWFVIH